MSSCVCIVASLFELESSDSCENDYLEVFEGGILSSNSRGRFCGNQPPVNLTADRYFLVKFHSNAQVPGRGFAASFNSRELNNSCFLSPV